MKKFLFTGLLIGIVGGFAISTVVTATAPKITVGKFVYMQLDPNGPHTNAEGFKYSYKTGYLGVFLRNGQLFLQTMDCGTATSSYPSYPPCYYEYGVDEGTPFFVYGNMTLPSAQ